MSKFAITAWSHITQLPHRAEPASRARAAAAIGGRFAARRAPGLFRRLLTWLLRCQERATMRDDLRHMPDWLLQDLGITRHAALRESGRLVSRGQRLRR